VAAYRGLCGVLVSRPLQSPPERPPRATARGTGHIHFDTMLLHRLKQPAPVAGILRRRSAHFLTWPPTVPARPHPSTELHAAYGLGDWFVASLVSSVVSWPVAFAVDSLWGSFLLPHVQSIREGKWVQEAEAASLVPKALGSYLGAHLFVPRAWWFYKLTLLPALPLSFGISLVIYFATTDGGARREAVDGWAGPEVRPWPRP
jgi:hypothetical protein